MSDVYWDRLMKAYADLGSLGSEHPSVQDPDPELAAFLAAQTPEEASYRAPATVATQDITVSHESGSFDIRTYMPTTTTTGRPLMVWCHGGGWAAGDLEGPEADATSREVAVRADAAVISVDYRLARGGVHYPIPLQDVVAAYLWAREHAEDLGADPERITLAGASAGGNLAAGAALWLRDHGIPMPARLALAYPTLHPVLPPASAELRTKLDRLSRVASAEKEVLTPMIENYLGGPVEDAAPYAMPGVSGDLTGLPPTYIFNSEYDGLRASAERFAHQLAEAGSFVALETLADVAHGHFARPGLAQSRTSHRDLAAWVADATVAPAASVIETEAKASRG